MPLQVRLQLLPGLGVQLQFASFSHRTSQGPAVQVTRHTLCPVHTVLLRPSDAAQVESSAQVSPASAPAVMLQVAPPRHFTVAPAPSCALQVDRFEQVLLTS